MRTNRNQLCPLCLGLPLSKASHSPDGCGRLKFLNKERESANLQLVTIDEDDGYIHWVNAPPELDVQETLHSLISENRDLRKETDDLKKEVETLKSSLEEIKSSLEEIKSKESRPSQYREEYRKHDGSGSRGSRGRGNGRGGRRGSGVAV